MCCTRTCVRLHARPGATLTCGAQQDLLTALKNMAAQKKFYEMVRACAIPFELVAVLVSVR